MAHLSTEETYADLHLRGFLLHTVVRQRLISSVTVKTNMQQL